MFNVSTGKAVKGGSCKTAGSVLCLTFEPTGSHLWAGDSKVRVGGGGGMVDGCGLFLQGSVYSFQMDKISWKLTRSKRYDDFVFFSSLPFPTHHTVHTRQGYMASVASSPLFSPSCTLSSHDEMLTPPDQHSAPINPFLPQCGGIPWMRADVHILSHMDQP